MTSSTASDDTVPWVIHINDIIRVYIDESYSKAMPTSTTCWFFALNNLQSIEGLEYLNTSRVKYMYGMFAYSNIITLDLSNFDTTSVTEMICMFEGCSALTQLDLSPFDTLNVTNMNSMFRKCDVLETIYTAPDQFNIDKVEDSGGMFSQCESLVGGNGTRVSITDASMAHIDTVDNPGYFTAK